jgi:hypothetical protein
VALLGDRGTGKTTVLEWVLRLVGGEFPPQLHKRNKTPLKGKIAPWCASLKKQNRFKDTRVLILPILDASLGDDQDSLRYQLSFALCRALERSETAQPDKLKRARAAIEQLTFAMAGQDDAWRAATARLSSDMGDFGVLTQRRVEGVVDFGWNFGLALAEVLKATEHDIAVLPMDDLDLVPQQYADVIGVLGDVRWADRLVVVLAADPGDLLLRVEKSLKGSPSYRSELVQIQCVQAEDAAGERFLYRRMAQRVLAKACPLQLRAVLPAPTPGQRLAFPVAAGQAYFRADSRIDSIAGLLVHLGVVAPTDVGGGARPYRPSWGHLLPDNLRGLDALLGLLIDLANIYDRNQLRLGEPSPAAPEPALEQAGTADQLPSNSDLQSADAIDHRDLARADGPPELEGVDDDFAETWQYEQSVAGTNLAPITLLAVAAIADVAGLYAWMRELQRYAAEMATGDMGASLVLLRRNFDLEARPGRTEIGSIGHSDFVALHAALATGRRLEDWFAVEPGNLLGDPAADLINGPAVFAPAMADLALRRAPGYRVAFAVNWWFTRQALDQRRLNPIVVGEARAPRTMRWVVSRLQVLGANVNEFPLFEGLADLISLCEGLGHPDELRVQHVAVREQGDYDIIKQYLVPQTFKGSRAQAIDEFCVDFISFIGGLWLLRRAMVRAWAQQHDPEHGRTSLSAPMVPDGELGVSLKFVLAQLVKDPESELGVDFSRRGQPKRATRPPPNHRWAAMLEGGGALWLAPADWSRLRDSLSTPSK